MGRHPTPTHCAEPGNVFQRLLLVEEDVGQALPPSNASIFMYDAISMYTNINIDNCIKRLADYLLNPHTGTLYPHLYPQPLIEALCIVMKNNRIRFGDLIAHQHKGIVMGM
jgi:hypothetical protein